MFAFSNVKLPSLSKLVGGTLRLSLNEPYTDMMSIALPVINGVRNMSCAVNKMQGKMCNVELIKADVDDIDWELNKEECMELICFAIET